MFLAPRERVELFFDSYPPGPILWLVDPIPPPPLEVTKRLEDLLSLGPPAELGRELEAIALLEELPFLDELPLLSDSPLPTCEKTYKAMRSFAMFFFLRK